MKKLVTLFFLLLSFLCIEAKTDLEIDGYKGSVKTVNIVRLYGDNRALLSGKTYDKYGNKILHIDYSGSNHYTKLNKKELRHSKKKITHIGNVCDRVEELRKRDSLGNVTEMKYCRNNTLQYTMKYSYENNLKTEEFKIMNDTIQSRDTFMYDADGKLIRSLRFNSRGVQISDATLKYDESGTISESVRYGDVMGSYCITKYNKGEATESHYFDNKGNEVISFYISTKYDKEGNVISLEERSSVMEVSPNKFEYFYEYY